MRVFVWAVVLSVLAGGCGDDDGTVASGAEPGSLMGRTFLSESVTDGGNARPLEENTRVRLAFHDDGRITVSAGCNTMGGSVEVEADRIVVSDLSMTEVGCDPALHEQDQWLADLLAGDPGYLLDGDRLRLSSNRIVIRLVDREVADPDRPLESTVWELDGIIDGQAVSSVPAGAGATLVFGDGRVTVEVEACNEGGAAVEIGNSEIEVGSLTMTDVACEGPAAEVEAAIVSVLDGRITYEVEAASLELLHPSGKGLTLRASG